MNKNKSSHLFKIGISLDNIESQEIKIEELLKKYKIGKPIDNDKN